MIFRRVPEKTTNGVEENLTILVQIPVYTQSFFINLIYVQYLIYVQPGFLIYVRICT